MRSIMRAGGYYSSWQVRDMRIIRKVKGKKYPMDERVLIADILAGK